jgi:hypothetical protein
MKKTNKENPLTTFRKANEARQGKVMKSLKKAQDGIQTNENSEDMMINKPGSTGGYKKPTSDMLNSYKQKLADDQYKESVKTSRNNLGEVYDNYIKKNITNKQKTDDLNKLYPNYQIPPQKKGGSVKRKK